MPSVCKSSVAAVYSLRSSAVSAVPAPGLAGSTERSRPEKRLTTSLAGARSSALQTACTMAAPDFASRTSSALPLLSDHRVSPGRIHSSPAKAGTGIQAWAGPWPLGISTVVVISWCRQAPGAGAKLAARAALGTAQTMASALPLLSKLRRVISIVSSTGFKWSVGSRVGAPAAGRGRLACAPLQGRGIHPIHFALHLKERSAIDQDKGRGQRRDTPGLHGDPVRIEQNRETDRQAIEEAADARLGLAYVDRQHLDGLAAEMRGHPVKRGKLVAARLAPGREKVNEHDAAGQLLEVEASAIEGGERKRRDVSLLPWLKTRARRRGNKRAVQQSKDPHRAQGARRSPES